ncbi:MAG TPA: hypothetical protein VFR03_05125 [Thermoanaerobaculia bacterium]|nr:hypothetical protein [Thermoanaerobaculia bacterium]
MQRTIRSFVLALVLLVLAAGAVHARPLAVRSAPAGFFDGIWQWVLVHIPSWTKEGGMIDPNGARPNLAPLPTTDAGSEMDPNG